MGEMGEMGGVSFLANYDNTKKAILEIVDLPDRLIDLGILLRGPARITLGIVGPPGVMSHLKSLLLRSKIP